MRVLIAAATLRKLERYRPILADAGCEVVFPPVNRQMTEDEILAALAGTDVVLAGSEPYTARVLDANPQLRAICRIGVGYDAVDVAAATERGILVTISTGNHEAVAEHTFGLMLALVKNLLPQDARIREGGWPRYPTEPLRGRVLGIVGLGRIGKQVALRAGVFRMPVIAAEPAPDHEFIEKHGIRLVPHETLFAEADIVSLHLPLVPDTYRLIDRRYLSMMKPTAYLLNTARGGVVNETDLIDALASRRIAGAGLDVFECEPLRDSPLTKLDNVVLTAHTAGVDALASEEMACLAAQTAVQILKGERPEEMIVNTECGRSEEVGKPRSGCVLVKG
jgi:phosphoglycerate dehydrogenase-like enzyme